MFLIDTDVLSALRRRDREPRLARWMSEQRTEDLYLSVVTVGEIEKGIVAARHREPRFANTLGTWLAEVLKLYGERVLPVDLPTARRWGQLAAAIGHQGADLLIAATALEHGLTVATRNVRHFKPAGVAVLDLQERTGQHHPQAT